VTGKTQSGKTSLVKKLLPTYRNYIVYDVKRQYGTLGAIIHNISELDLAVKNGCSRLIYQPNTLDIDHFNTVCEWIYTHLRHILFVVEEVHKFATKHKIPTHFNTIITVAEGDPHYIGVMSISQRPANVHNDVLTQTSVTISFRHNSPSDAEAVAGIPANTILELLPYHYAVFNDADFEGKIHIYKLIL